MKLTSKILTGILAVALVISFIPSFITRVTNESKNNNVVVSLHYNDIANRYMGEELDKVLKEYYDLGVTTVTVAEENVNAMVARGAVTNIKYNVLRHKFDDESLLLADIIDEKAPKTSYDSQLLITKDKETAEFIAKSLSERLSDEEFRGFEANNGMTVFCIYDGVLPVNEIVLGYDESAIENLTNMGFDICLSVSMQDNASTKYLETLNSLVEKYNVKHLSIRKSLKSPEKPTDGKAHYEGISDIINKNDLTLVVTEDATQLSNEKPFGYDYIFENSKKVVRAYETHDASHADESKYLFRYQQYLNSTIDRNIRFISLTTIYLLNTTVEDMTDYTQKAAKTYIDKMNSLGFTVNEETVDVNYTASLKDICARSAALMVLVVYLMFLFVTKYDNKKLTVGAFVLAILAFVGTYVIPQSLLSLYSTAWAVIFPCFGVTVSLVILEKFKEKLPAYLLAIITPLAVVAIMSVGGLVMSSLLSGGGYYFNNDIFRGIKLSLFAPVVFSLIAYYWMFVKNNRSLLNDMKAVAMYEVKVYWIVLAAIIGIVGVIYIQRSGNVNTISDFETAMRNFITELFPERPRTKEFIVGYPCLVLLAYYMKKTNFKLIQAVLVAGSAILAASISNSFCHVFTDASTIYLRVVNGLIIGAAVSVVVYIANLVLVKIVKRICKYMDKAEL